KQCSLAEEAARPEDLAGQHGSLLCFFGVRGAEIPQAACSLASRRGSRCLWQNDSDFSIRNEVHGFSDFSRSEDVLSLRERFEREAFQQVSSEVWVDLHHALEQRHLYQQRFAEMG